MKAKNFKEVLIGAFCENGVGSGKRIIGAFIVLGVVFCTIWACIHEGMTDNIKSIVETEILTAGGLLGIASVTSIWKKKYTVDEEETEKKED